MKILIANIPDAQYEVIQKFVELNIYKDKSCFVRQAIKNFFWDEAEGELDADNRVTLGNKMLDADEEMEKYEKEHDISQVMRT